MRAKMILRAGLKKEILFQTKGDFEDHIFHLKSRKRKYKVLEKHEGSDGSVQVTIVEDYNGAKLLA